MTTDTSPWSNRTGLLASVAFCELVGIVPGALTAGDVAGWYQTLEQPGLTPPDWVFGPVWTALFAAMGVALHLVRERRDSPTRDRALGLFVLQLALNASWTLVFFGEHSIVGGLATIAGLWLAIVATAIAFWRESRLAAALLVPYLLWVTFAAYLNLEIWRLN